MSLDETLARWRRGIVHRVRPRPRTEQEVFLDAQRRSGTFVFIHINKCGGTSVEKALGLPKIHDTAMQRRDRIGAARWAEMATFSIVRHPYDKVASHYRYRVETNQTDLATRRIDLNDWVRRAYGDRDPALYDKPLMFAPCLDWLTDETGTMMVDHVARLETIATDWPRIQSLIGTQAELPHTNATTDRHRAADALDETSRTIIAQRFAVDFESFGYEP